MTAPVTALPPISWRRLTNHEFRLEQLRARARALRGQDGIADQLADLKASLAKLVGPGRESSRGVDWLRDQEAFDFSWDKMRLSAGCGCPDAEEVANA